MSRTTIDFGIDLGTTNSEIAVLRGTIADIIKNNLNNDITPSAVFIDKRGQMQVGQRAKNRLEDENTADDVYIEVKRLMGTDHIYKFKTSGRNMRPEEVSAEILKSLRGDVQQRLGEDIQAAVITVPAAFEQKQCAATKKAGELAGFIQCPLLQEPVAAALAYGFQVDVTKEFWLIYDFGGGTFDAAIMKAEDCSITVVNHGGDNYLGGSDIDWAVIEQFIIPELSDNFNLPNFSRGDQEKWRTAFAVIKRAIEEAKIQLSRSETAYLEGCKFKDADGKQIDVDFKLTRDALIGVAEPIIMRSVSICKRVLKEKNLNPNAIEKLILIGGPTLAPYFREILQSSLGIQLDYSVDPLTVVARGAAVFAGTQRFEGRVAPKVATGQFAVELKYKPVGADEDPTIRGKIKSETVKNLEGFTIEFVNQKTHWRSGKIPLEDDGRFKVTLLAEKGSQNIFTIELLDAKGSKQATVPESLSYTIGLTISEQTIPNSIAVALANNEADVFFKKGEPLPVKATHILRSTHALKKGESGDVLKVPVVEGEIEIADRNRLLGTLEIKGTDERVCRDVPAGSEVEVTLHYDTSRIIWTKAYIPMLDEEFAVKIVTNERNPDHKQLQQDYNDEIERLDSLHDKANEADDSRACEMLDEVTNSGGIESLEKLIIAAKGDDVAANQAEKLLLEVKVTLDRAENALKWPALVAEVNNALDELDELIKAHGKANHKERANRLREQTHDFIEQQRMEPLRKKLEKIIDLHREILFEQPGFWLGYFNYMTEEQEKMNDQIAAERLIDQGHQCINRGNVQGLRNVVAQLLRLLPHEVAEAIQRGYQSGLLK